MLIFEKQNTIAPLTLAIEQEGVGGVTAKAPTIAIRNAQTLDSYLDFTDSTFKTTGWAMKYLTITEIERGHYTYFLDPSSISDISIGSILSAEYFIDDGGAIKGIDQETILIVESILNIPTDTATLISTVGGALTPDQANWLKEIWRILGLDPIAPLVVSKTARSAGASIGQTIEKNVPMAGSITVTRT